MPSVKSFSHAGWAKKRIIAETGAGQHGVATATVAAKFDMECEVYMGEEDIERQALNVFRMQLMGTKVVPVNSGSRTLKDAINACFRDWVTNVRTTYPTARFGCRRAPLSDDRPRLPSRHRVKKHEHRFWRKKAHYQIALSPVSVAAQ